jgi:hypothetical protein
MNRKTGTDNRAYPEIERADAFAPAPQSKHTERKDITRRPLPAPVLDAPKRRFVEPGVYEATCTKAEYSWHRRYLRWDAVFFFKLDGAEPGPDLEKHVSLGTDPDQPHIGGDTWLANTLLARFGGTSDISVLAGHRFLVRVDPVVQRKRTSKEVEQEIDLPPRPSSEWYSVVRSVELIDDVDDADLPEWTSLS